MKVVPRPLEALIAFAESHQAQWGLEPETIGLTKEQTDLLYERMKTAREKRDLALAARAAARAATTTMNAEVGTLRACLSGLIGTIRAFAENGGSGDEPAAEVLGRAQVPVPGASSSAAARGQPPGKPLNIRVDISATGGALTLHWTAARAAAGSGGRFEIARRVMRRAPAPPGHDGFVVLGTVAGTGRSRRALSYTDDAIPTDAFALVYQITPIRRANRGEASDAITVEWNGRGGADAPSTPAQLAASRAA